MQGFAAIVAGLVLGCGSSSGSATVDANGLDGAADSGATLSTYTYVKATNTAAASGFGALAISRDGNRLVVGASSEDAGGIENAGAVYVFARAPGGAWTPEAYITSPSPEITTMFSESFGQEVAISGDGNTIAVGAPYERSAATGIDGDASDSGSPVSGAVYLYSRSGATWTLAAYVKASNTGAADYFGTSVALSELGDTLVVGAPSEDSAATGVGGIQTDDSQQDSGAAYVFQRTASGWTQQGYLKPSNTHAGARFGNAVSIAGDGNTLVVAAYRERGAGRGVNDTQGPLTAASSGAVYVFRRSGSVWSQDAYLKSSNSQAEDQFGTHVALSHDASTLVVGAPEEDSASVGIDGDQLDELLMDSGAAYVFGWSGAWTQEAYVKASHTDVGDKLGAAVAISDDGSNVLVGVRSEDSAATGIDGNAADNSAAGSGAVFAFQRHAAGWMQRAYIKASNTDAMDSFGSSFFGVVLGISGDGAVVAIGARNEDSSATGINGDASDNSMESAGAVYVVE